MGWLILVPLKVTHFMTSSGEGFKGIPVLGVLVVETRSLSPKIFERVARASLI